MSEQHSSNALTRKQIFKFEHVEIYYCHIPLILKKHAWRRRCHFRWTGEGYWNPRPLKFGHPKNFFEWRRSVPKSPNLSKIPKKNWIPTLFVKLYNPQLEAYYTIQILIIQSHLSKPEKKYSTNYPKLQLLGIQIHSCISLYVYPSFCRKISRWIKTI